MSTTTVYGLQSKHMHLMRWTLIDLLEQKEAQPTFFVSFAFNLLALIFHETVSLYKWFDKPKAITPKCIRDHETCTSFQWKRWPLLFLYKYSAMANHIGCLCGSQIDFDLSKQHKFKTNKRFNMPKTKHDTDIHEKVCNSPSTKRNYSNRMGKQRHWMSQTRD